MAYFWSYIAIIFHFSSWLIYDHRNYPMNETILIIEWQKISIGLIILPLRILFFIRLFSLTEISTGSDLQHISFSCLFVYLCDKLLLASDQAIEKQTNIFKLPLYKKFVYFDSFIHSFICASGNDSPAYMFRCICGQFSFNDFWSTL